MMSRIWRLPDEVKAKYDTRSLRTAWHLAAPCPPWLKQAFIEWWGADTIMELYAGTEAQAVTIITGAEWLEHRGSVGKVAVGEMAAFDADGARLPPGEVGEVFMRRPEGSPPSYAYRGATPRTLLGGWESLGDIGWFDTDGYLYLADRRTDMILVGGSNVYPAEIESALDEHPLVQSSAVIGLPDEDLGRPHPRHRPAEGRPHRGRSAFPRRRPAGDLQAAANLRIRRREHPRRRRQGAADDATEGGEDRGHGVVTARQDYGAVLWVVAVFPRASGDVDGLTGGADPDTGRTGCRRSCCYERCTGRSPTCWSAPAHCRRW